MDKKMVELGLRDIRSATHVANMATFRALLCEVLDFFDEVLSSQDEGLDGEKLCAKVGHFRGLLAAAVDQGHIAAISAPLLGVCQETFERLKRQREVTRDEIAGLIIHVRNALPEIVSEDTAFTQDLGSSTERLDAGHRIPDIQELKTALAREVWCLKQVAREREQRWQSTVSALEARVSRLETELLASKEEASVDPLTGVANRREFDSVLRAAVDGRGRRLVLAVLDVDNFKRINDTFGHSAGDQVLKVVAETLKSTVRDGDVVARIGGDEFALVASGLTLAQADRRMRSMMALLGEANVGMEGVRVTVSCGMAEISAGDTIPSLTARADDAVYEAKRHGKNHIITSPTPYIRDLRAS